jgi:DNA-3-methyladenine glycosylase I
VRLGRHRRYAACPIPRQRSGGTRTFDESALFEALTLGVFQAGLSWEIVFGKPDAFQKVFRGFDVAKVARMTSRDVSRLVEDAGRHP